MSYFWRDRPIRVKTNPLGLPCSLVWRRQVHHVTRIDNHWRVDEGWWKEEGHIGRDYWKLVTDSDLLVVIYYDLYRAGWYMYRECD
jgi:hypothetical protein